MNHIIASNVPYLSLNFTLHSLLAPLTYTAKK